jgi:hypothetical protein
MRPNCSKSDDENARSLAKTGARIGAAAGNRVGPVTTGLTSGFGGAVGYLTGAALDGVQAKLDEKTPIPDGGQRTDGHSESVEIPVVDETEN